MLCKFLKTDNSLCQANAMLDSEFCYLHNPNISKDDKNTARSKGGKSNAVSLKMPLKRLKINEAKDVVGLLVQTINEVRGGQIEVRLANCLGVLSGHLIKAFEVSDLEQRLTKLEQAVNDKITA
jgi:hypothetical protein